MPLEYTGVPFYFSLILDHDEKSLNFPCDSVLNIMCKIICFARRTRNPVQRFHWLAPALSKRRHTISNISYNFAKIQSIIYSMTFQEGKTFSADIIKTIQTYPKPSPKTVKSISAFINNWILQTMGPSFTILKHIL